MRAAEAALERNRARLDDLNVYPVPDGDTGTNMLLTVRAVREALEAGESDVAHAALLGARGNSGVILSQIVRGAVEGYAEDGSVATALRRGSDAAYAAVREPVEGTILTVSRALAEEAEAHSDAELPELFAQLVRRGDEAVEQTRDQLDVLRKAGVVDAGAAGLVEIVRGIAAHLSGEPLPEVAGAGADRGRCDPPGGLALPLLRRLRRHGRHARRSRRSSETWRRSATRCSWSATQPR